MTIAALVIATAIPLVTLFIIYKLDLYKTGAFRFVLLSFFTGSVAYFLAAQINPLSLKWLDYTSMVRYLAPVVEEILKSLILLYLVRRSDFTCFIDGAIYGFAAGIGFAIFENIEYIFGSPGAALPTAASRVVSTNLMHAAATASIGIVLGQTRFRRFTGRAILSVTGVLISIILHMGFNNMVTRTTSGWLLLYAVVVGGGAAGFVAFAIKRGLKQEKLWIEKHLDAAERVDYTEVAAVTGMEILDKKLAPLVEVFGADKAAKIEKLLLIQARLGIIKNNLEQTSVEEMRVELHNQITDLRKQMEHLRTKEIGNYAMLYLRQTYLQPDIKIYANLQQALDERRTASPDGVNIFNALSQKLTPAPETPKDHTS
ncbi:MAG: PrsW family intramembrane metalloprotease [Chloroflexi bacterium]|nr:PrsW family intramembrane metalloprotease [Chloroflexota bacterium]